MEKRRYAWQRVADRVRLIINMMRICACDSGKMGGLDADEKVT